MWLKIVALHVAVLQEQSTVLAEGFALYVHVGDAGPAAVAVAAVSIHPPFLVANPGRGVGAHSAAEGQFGVAVGTFVFALLEFDVDNPACAFGVVLGVGVV